ncbi:transcription factor HES-7.1-like [Pyxicephalus adspersus]|uniref:transcription factor HES-7.1-like n=1 Tax=Pyxicephalus adspersus TaxID=30357 RepID=UPI003B5A64D4
MGVVRGGFKLCAGCTCQCLAAAAMSGEDPAEDKARARRILKPRLEKRRRTRINQSLEEMRVHLLKLTGNRKLHNPKVEKAEILEMTVNYVRNTFLMKMHDPEQWLSPSEKLFISGFRDCLTHTENFIQEIVPSAKNRLLNGLHAHLQGKFCFIKPPDSNGQVDGQPGNSSCEGTAGPLTPSVSGSVPSWPACTLANPGAYQVAPNPASMPVWRPWP